MTYSFHISNRLASSMRKPHYLQHIHKLCFKLNSYQCFSISSNTLSATRGTLEWRCFESTLHAGKVRANITLALAISAQAINQSRTVMRKTEISENPAFTFRTFLLRLGLIGPEYKNVREHLLSNLPGDRAWRYDKAQYPSLQNRRNQER